MWEKKETRETRLPEAPPSRSTFDAGVRGGSDSLVNIGPSIFIKGELSGDEDLTIEGRVEGKIELKGHNLTIGPKGKINAAVHANTVTIKGEVTGNVFARERVEIADSGRLNGDITSPRIIIADGAHFRGAVDMNKESGQGNQRERERHQAQPQGVGALSAAGEPSGALRGAAAVK